MSLDLSDPHPSNSQVLGVQVYTITPGLCGAEVKARTFCTLGSPN